MAPSIVSKSARRPVFGGGGRWQAFGGRPVRLTANGRVAIVGGLRALGLPKGASILMPAWHCGSEVDAVIAAGGRPVLYRQGADMTPDMDDLERKAQEHAPWGIYVIHYFGYPQPVAQIGAIADDHGARLIEDVALGLLSNTPSGEPLGSAGQMTVYSLVKTLPVPDGGALWLRNPAAHSRFRWPGPHRELRGLAAMAKWHLRRNGPLSDRFAGVSEQELDRWCADAGIDPLRPLGTACFVTKALLAAMDFDAVREKHRRNYQALWEELSDRTGVRAVLGRLPQGACPAYFPLWVEDPDRASAALAASGVESVRFLRRFHHAVDLADFPDIIDLKRRTIRLPIHPEVGEEAVRRIVAAFG